MRDTVPYVLAWDFKTSKPRGVPPKLQGRIWDGNTTNDIYQCEIVLISIYSPRKTGIFSVNGVALCLQSDSTSPSDER